MGARLAEPLADGSQISLELSQTEKSRSNFPQTCWGQVTSLLCASLDTVAWCFLHIQGYEMKYRYKNRKGHAWALWLGWWSEQWVCQAH